LARDGAWYVGGDLGPMIVEDINVDIGTTDNAVTINHVYGFDADVFVGFDLGSFRIEAEVAYKKADLDEVQNTCGCQARCDVPGEHEGAGNTDALSFMVNGMLDFGDDESGLSGFIGGGVGIARVEFNNARVFDNQGAFLDDSDTRFAWQVIAGVRQAITDNVDIQVKYRFFNVDDVSMLAGGGGGSAIGGRETNARFRTHSLMGGIVFNFGAPPPPAPPPPPEAPPYVPPPPPEPAPPQPPVVTPGPFIVFFDWDRSDITPQAAAILDNAAAAYQQTGSAQVVLAGHADKSGSASYNVGLSQRRADAVRSYLAGRGIPDGALSTEAFGESRPLVETADGVREPQNRRVEITFGPGSGM
jgi:outer membrane protein OmpA-like peptidoglycan-associated protein